MKPKIIKYIILILLGSLMLYQFIPIGDYCDGMANGLFFLALGVLFLLAFLIILIFDIIKRVKHKQQFDFIPLIIFIIVVGCNYSLLKVENKKFWTTEVLIADLEQDNFIRTNRITLYNNNSFAITDFRTDYQCTIQGNYTLKGDTLKLDRKDLSELTDNVFTSHYIISKSDSILVAINKKFENIMISNFLKDI